MDICFDTTHAAHMASFAALEHTCREGDRYHFGDVLPAGSARQRCFMILGDDGKPRARVAAEHTDLVWRNQRVGLLGYYEAIESATSIDCQQLLDAACAYLTTLGCEIAIGPVNSSTWGRYRFNEANHTRPFLLDVDHPDRYPGQWRNAGFVPVERYLSYLFEKDQILFNEKSNGNADGYRRRLAGRGITVESVQPGAFEADLNGIHTLCLEAFTANPLFTPIDFEAFANLYRPAVALVDPRWTLIARNRDGDISGFAFAYPDLFDPEGSTLIVKTVATKPGRETQGLGIWLTRCLHAQARASGMTRVIHALMHEHNSPTLAGAAAASVHRRYLLLGKPL